MVGGFLRSATRTARFGPNAAAVGALLVQLQTGDLLTFRLLGRLPDGSGRRQRDGARAGAVTAARAGARTGAVDAARDAMWAALRPAGRLAEECVDATAADAVLGTVVRDLIDEVAWTALLDPWRLAFRVRNELAAAGAAVEEAAERALDDGLDVPLDELPSLCREVIEDRARTRPVTPD